MEVYEKCASLVSWILRSECWPRYMQLRCVFQKDIVLLQFLSAQQNKAATLYLQIARVTFQNALGQGTLCKLKWAFRQKLSSHPRKPGDRKMQDSWLSEKRMRERKEKKAMISVCVYQRLNTIIFQIYVEFASPEDSKNAAQSLAGRKFANRVVVTSFYSPEMYHRKEFHQLMTSYQSLETVVLVKMGR